ncbi:hypothetical protein NP493_249g05000 [Ridgeia piscesae]|uniref:Uncharacterized protein n=1 Tax=Ridgeia piscesae TaxID=27915 RepID=A0AAD9UD11_RIDPI|nr:hypothetical protein NP493_249g05000 [Ridgeia piscesae]
MRDDSGPSAVNTTCKVTCCCISLPSDVFKTSLQCTQPETACLAGVSSTMVAPALFRSSMSINCHDRNNASPIQLVDAVFLESSLGWRYGILAIVVQFIMCSNWIE